MIPFPHFDTWSPPMTRSRRKGIIAQKSTRFIGCLKNRNFLGEQMNLRMWIQAEQSNAKPVHCTGVEAEKSFKNENKPWFQWGAYVYVKKWMRALAAFEAGSGRGMILMWRTWCSILPERTGRLRFLKCCSFIDGRLKLGTLDEENQDKDES